MPPATDHVASRPAHRTLDAGLVTALVVLVVLLPVSLAALAAADPPLDAGTTVMLAGCFIALHAASLVALRFPVAAFAAASLVMLALVVVPSARGAAGAMYPSSIAYLLCLTQLAVRTPPRLSIPGLVTGVIGAGLVALLEPAFGRGSDADVALLRLGAFLGLSAAVVAAWAVGLLLRVRAARVEEQTRRRVEQAIADERLRISGELHDVVAHAMTVMMAQSEAARAMMPTRPDDSDRALEVVARTGRDALRGMRAIVAADGGAPLAPQPTPAALDELVSSVRGPACEATLTESGSRRELTPAVALALHHTVREALTNAVRHTIPPVRIDVTLDWGETLVVRIADDGGAGGAAFDLGAGTGLIGLAERVRLAGGSFAAGPGMPHGWVVRAELPAASIDEGGGS
ncbi:two-component sensor histidine kinase [Microbacterium sp. NEAU-LLC]|uniref:histidine kinase n=1 Tax=Microbacterium helvum TaxID=2773713 RepID=A0ABR8NKG1_9MICO|nr:histidine kinase [Microbacterium helvum]MBD3941140.1 two-component sensor histidine kinase [Microbacterium helvum]